MGDINAKDILYSFYKKKLMIVIFILVAGLLGVVYVTFFLTPLYKADTSLLLVKKDLESNNSVTQTDMQLNQQLVSTYTEILKSRAVINDVITNLELDTTYEKLSNSISVVPKNKTELLQITVEAKEPKMAVDIANTISEVFLKKVKQIYKMENVSLIDKAQEPTSPFNINIVKTTMVFALFGFASVSAIILIKIFTDTTIKNEADIENATGLTVLSVVPEKKD